MFKKMFCSYNFHKNVALNVLFSQRTQAALQALNAVHTGNMSMTGSTISEGAVLAGQSSVLRIIVENLFYPVTLEVLHQVKN